MFLGIEIGGTKLQLGLGPGDGTLAALWRRAVDPAAGAAGILRQIEAGVPELLAAAGRFLTDVRGTGVGFGGPTDDATQSVVKSHHVEGWADFPLAAWVAERTGRPAVVCNDADVAGLAEARLGAGRGLSPVFYMTVGSGIGGGLVIDGEVYRGCGKGASEVGHLRVDGEGNILEHYASGWGIGARARERLERGGGGGSVLLELAGGGVADVTGKHVAEAEARGDPLAAAVMDQARRALARAVGEVIRLVCPRRVVIGGGVSLIGEERFFRPIRELVERDMFQAFAGLIDIVPAGLGEEVVVHGALALARQRFGG
jgi:glucokinase